MTVTRKTSDDSDMKNFRCFFLICLKMFYWVLNSLCTTKARWVKMTCKIPHIHNLSPFRPDAHYLYQNMYTHIYKYAYVYICIYMLYPYICIQIFIHIWKDFFYSNKLSPLFHKRLPQFPNAFPRLRWVLF